jgi:hypothetical protein
MGAFGPLAGARLFTLALVRLLKRPPVLEFFFSEIGEVFLQAITHLAIGVQGKTDTAWISNAFKPRGNIDAIAHQVAVTLLNHVAEVDADAELDAALRGQASVALDHAVLQLDGAAHGVHDASELCEDPVTRPLDDATVMDGDGRSIRSLRSARSLARVRSSSEPASLLYPATSAARMAASFRVSAMAAPFTTRETSTFAHWPRQVVLPG